MSEMPPVPEPEIVASAAPVPSLGRSLITDVIKFAVFFAILYLYVMQVSVVRGSSMEPTFHDGDRLVVDKLTYLLSDIDRFDVIVLRAPNQRGMDFIKRVIALPGESVQIREGRLYIDGRETSQEFLMSHSSDTFGPKVVPEGEYFVLGDNRPYSNDSRSFGFIKRDSVRGKIRVRFWPLDHFHFYP